MILNYSECIHKYGNQNSLKKALQEKQIFKIEKGIYSTQEFVSDYEIIAKKYPYAVYTLYSAFYIYGLTETIPQYHYLITDKNASRIKNKNIKQLFDNANSLEIGVCKIEFQKCEITLFNKERLLIELIRNKNNMPFDYYKEVLRNYRGIINELDFSMIDDYIKVLPKSKFVNKVLILEVL